MYYYYPIIILLGLVLSLYLNRFLLVIELIYIIDITWALTIIISSVEALNGNYQQQKEVHMHKYMILIEVPSTSPLHGVKGINTKSKVRVVGVTKASNSSNACSKVSKKLGISYDKLKALLYTVRNDGKWVYETYTT